jgi:hypothetical protein
VRVFPKFPVPGVATPVFRSGPHSVLEFVEGFGLRVDPGRRWAGKSKMEELLGGVQTLPLLRGSVLLLGGGIPVGFQPGPEELSALRSREVTSRRSKVRPNATSSHGMGRAHEEDSRRHCRVH